MGVREQHAPHLEIEVANDAQQLVDLVSRIDESRLSRLLAAHDEPVLVEGRDGPHLDDHPMLLLTLDTTIDPRRHADLDIKLRVRSVPNMILCALDDLIFSVRISTAARQLGVDVYFERDAAQVVPRIREKRPALVIFDLNSGRLDPLGAIRSIKTDPELQSVRTLGFVSHVDSETIDAARRAGIDQVLARSAFVERLGDILTSA
jgi:CheY-like chemotaxis protein